MIMAFVAALAQVANGVRGEEMQDIYKKTSNWFINK